MKTKYLIAAVSLLLFNCSGEGDTKEGETLEEKVENMIPRSEQNPCDFLTEDVVREAANVAPDITITNSNRFNTCNFSWEVESEKMSQEEYLAATMEMVKSGKVGNLKSLQQGSYSVSLNFTNVELSGADQAKQTYETIKKRLTEGITVSKDAITEKAKEMGVDSKAVEKYAEDVTIQDKTLTDVSGVGDEAVWSTKSNQLTVLSGSDVFFINANASGKSEASLELAKKLADVVIDKL